MIVFVEYRGGDEKIDHWMLIYKRLGWKSNLIALLTTIHHCFDNVQCFFLEIGFLLLRFIPSLSRHPSVLEGRFKNDSLVPKRWKTVVHSNALVFTPLFGEASCFDEDSSRPGYTPSSLSWKCVGFQVRFISPGLPFFPGVAVKLWEGKVWLT